ALLDELPSNELMDFMSHPVYTDAQTTSVMHNPEGNPELTSYISGASETHDHQDPPTNREGEKKKKRRKKAGQSSTQTSRKDKAPMIQAQEDTHADQPQDQTDILIQQHPNPGWFTKKLGSANAIRRTT
nr:hypothetical protein [Tanacetum cinerariifolium]